MADAAHVVHLTCAFTLSNFLPQIRQPNYRHRSVSINSVLPGTPATPEYRLDHAAAMKALANKSLAGYDKPRLSRVV